MKPDFPGRLKKLRRIIAENGLDAAILSSPRDIYYYTGSRLTGDRAFLIAEPASKPLLLVSCLSNYTWKLKPARVRFFSDFKGIAKELNRYKKMGFDEKNLSSDFFLRLKKLGIRLRPFASQIKTPRMVKDDWEVSQIRKAVKATEDLFRGVKFLGVREAEVSAQLRKRAIEMGLEHAFPPIIASGRNSAFIHYLPGKRKIGERDLVVMDIGVRVNGYCSDMTRTFCMRPDSRKKKVYGDLLEIQGQVIDNVRAGIRFDTLDGFSEKLFRKLGYRKMHTIGHGVGLSVHERPFYRDTIQNGMLLTVEPGIYIKNWGGCRVEDIIHIRNNRARILPVFPRELNP
jgi:Xaa-Pro aminopeptidase